MHGDNIKNVRNFYMYLNNGAGGYIVYRKAGKGKYSKLANINKNTILSYTDKSAKNGTVYTYKNHFVKGYQDHEQGRKEDDC